MTDRLETRTRDIGGELFTRVMEHRPTTGSAAWWDDQLMRLTMGNEALKIQLFRFVDALPALRADCEITRHLREYFDQVQAQLPMSARLALRHMPDNGWAGSMIARAARFNANRLARKFIAGSNVSETITAIESLRRQCLAFTIDLLGEAVLSEPEAERYQSAYLRFVDGLTRQSAEWPMVPQIDLDDRGPIPRVNISVKLSSLYSQFDPIDPAATSRAVRDRLRPILRLARTRGAFVNIDMEQRSYKDLTIRIFQEALDEVEFRDWPDAGVAIQAYLRDSGDDLRNLAAWAQRRGTPVWVRLVKGAYWDYETIIAAQENWPIPVYTDKAATDANFEAQTAFLMERHDLLRPAIASHNIRSIAHALALVEKHDLPPRRIEFQTLYGMADAIKSTLVQRGQRVRVYTPFGQLLPGMAYLVRRLLENTSNTSFLRAGFLEHAPMEELLMNPLQKIRSHFQPTTAAREERPPEQPFRNEPLTDFTLQAGRDAMQVALDAVGRQLGGMYPLFIAGQHMQRTMTIDSINPSHRTQVVGRCASATIADAEAAVTAARDAFAAWRDTPPQRRAKLLQDAAAILRRRRLELAAWEVYESAKPWREADADIAEAIDFCEYYAAGMLKLCPPQPIDLPGEDNALLYEPRGVAVIIAPWNFPLAILCGMTAAALVTGNTAIMKPAEQSCVVAYKLMEVFEEARFPPGVVNLLSGIGEEIGPALVSHPDVSMIAFTGSRAVGLAINKLAAETPPVQSHIKHIIAELGGKNAIIVDEDADLDEACHGVAASAFGYSGQKCSACSRVILLDAIHDAFVARLVEVTRSLRIGPAEDPGTFVGPVIDDEARTRILSAIARGRQEAKLAYAGDVGPLADEGCYVAPHIFADVPPNATIAQEEIFGPVLAAIRARDLGHALSIANGTRYALTGGVYSRSPASIERIRREFRVGNLYINRKITGALVGRQPFGGFKLSGLGTKAGGADYLLQFMIPRTITENTLRRGFAPSAEPVADPSVGRGE